VAVQRSTPDAKTFVVTNNLVERAAVLADYHEVLEKAFILAG
jgi:hypothetical protein